MLPTLYTRIVLAERPTTNFTPTTFRKETVAFDLKPGPGEALVRVDWLSLDPTMRHWVRDTPFYLEPVQIGAVMRSIGLGTVLEAGEGCELRSGNIVSCLTGERLLGRRCTFGLFISTDRLDRVCRHKGERSVSKGHVSATAWLVRVLVA
jgi:NADPH-dependent curcumin reductase CurA